MVHVIIEKTAIEFAAVFYEAGRASGLTSKYKNPRAYAKANFEKFIPKAVEVLTGMLDRTDIPDLMKQEIYDALIERANSSDLHVLGIEDKIKPNYNLSVLHNQVNPFKVNN